MLTRPQTHRSLQPLRIPVPSPPTPEDLLCELNSQYTYSSPAQSPLTRASPSPSIETPASPFHPLLASRPHFYFDPLSPSTAMDFSRVLQLQTQAAYKRGSIDATNTTQTQTQPQAIPAPVERHPATLRSESSSDSSTSTSTSSSPLPTRRIGSISSTHRPSSTTLSAGKCSKCLRAFSTDAAAADQPLTLSNQKPICHRCAMAMVFGG